VFNQSGTNNIYFIFFLLSFSLDEKETKNQDNKNLPTHKARSTARFIVSPTLAKIQANIYKLFESSDNL
jgi:hypothetical protein